ncbi:Uncharacterised protein [Mobiluncus mulieris]|uniref:Fic family protein n=1 Tax=Mobiluncus mulieris TaxID=2052 RepID=UPI00019F9656|nr:hypothetical protein HMPREF0577_2232 [Mobiluncus mulieris ATCC 35243]SPX70209.1 Uncharacterised protein [Mobiluncus mulieris]
MLLIRLGGHDPSPPQVTTQVERLLEKLKAGQELSAKELIDSLRLASCAYFRKAYMVPALESGLIGMTIPDKPQS